MTLRRKLNLIYLSEFFVYFHLFGGVLIPFYTLWGGLNFTQMMLLQAWFSLMIVLFEIPTGTLADVMGRKKTILLGILINLFGVVIYGSLPVFWLFLIGETCFAFSYALYSGAKEALMYDTLIEHHQEKQSKNLFGRFKISHLLGLMVSAPLGSWIGTQLGLNWPMLLMVIPIFLAGMILMFVPEPKVHHDPDLDTLRTTTDKYGWAPARKPFFDQIRSGWKSFKDHPYLKIMTFDMVIIWSFAFMIIWFQQIVLTNVGVGIEYFGWFISFALGVQVLVLNWLPWLEKKLGSKKQVLSITGILPGVGFIFLALFPSVTTVFIALIMCSGFGLTRRTLYASYVNKYISSHQRATVNSFINIGPLTMTHRVRITLQLFRVRSLLSHQRHSHL